MQSTDHVIRYIRMKSSLSEVASKGKILFQ